ncbi:MAG: dual specificity protein phosphatase family protein [Methylomonas sp.]|uniref:dual specificity protein phosphatase family protein n=1 Tax=Methylomonas sp. TaxID=418 RepID=UPI0025E357F3|nr:dual specificity protein phosphatase [Methylomonas sp.]MCK9607825.1 dual specificity protein phosphatase family protein [Methylomonas sp.]
MNRETLLTSNVKTIINVASECNYRTPDFSPDIHLYKFDIKDEFISILDYLECIPAIIARRLTVGNILIHCQAGISRSPTIVIAYLMIYHRMKLNDAYAYLLKLRPRVFPNPQFMRDLMELEFKLFGSRSFNDKIDAHTVSYIASYAGLNTAEQRDIAAELYFSFECDYRRIIKYYDEQKINFQTVTSNLIFLEKKNYPRLIRSFTFQPIKAN